MRYPILAFVVLAGCVDQEPAELGERAAALQVCGGSLQAAIDGAPPDAVLEICAATYHERISIVGKRLVLRGVSGAAATVIDADGLGRALIVQDTGGTGVQLEGLTLREGNASSNGGGVACRSSTLRMRDSVVTGNRGAGGGGLGAESCALDVARTRFEDNDAGSARGGGLLVIGGSGLIADCTIAGNDAEEGGGVAIEGGTAEVADSDVTGNSAHRGGGLFVASGSRVHGNRIADNEGRWTGGGLYTDGAPVIEANVIDGNTSVNDGGGLYVNQHAPLILDNTFSHNQSGDDGGGVRLFESSARLEGNLIEHNVAADSGGGVRVSHVSAQLIDNVIRDNTAPQGGGLDLDNDASVLRGGEITGNHATNGGGLAAALYPYDTGVIEDVRIADNVATGVGGGLYVFDNYQPIALRHLVVVNNRAGRGAGLYVRGTNHTLANSTFTRNVATGDGGAIHVAAGSTSASYDFLVLHGNTASSGSALYAAAAVSLESSIVSQGSGTAVKVTVAPTYRYNDTWPATFSGMTSPIGSSGNLSADPRFADATAENFALGAGSPAIDAGDPALHDVNGSRADQGAHGGPGGTDLPPPPPPPTDPVVLEADAHVAADTPATNFGSATTIASDTSPMTEAYLRFRVTGAGAITGARLQLTVTNPTGDAPTLYAAASTWGEASLTWNARPALGAAIADLGAVSAGVIEYDVSSLVTGDGVYTLALIPTSTDGFAAYSREGATPPRLILTTGGPPPPPPAGSAVLEADTYATAVAPNTGFGGDAMLTSDQDPLEESYLRFRVTGLTTAPAHARLRLRVVDASSDGPAVYLADSAWSEASLTWNARPALTGGPIADVGAAAIGQTVEYDVTSAITGDGAYTFALIPTSGSGFGVSSREGATPPVLILE